ncbi:hypothetical protein [Methylorubrum suomiense]|uniref:Uncharacterized protein n=1 Tax=Methylorubrum suomiense TaxID=144191 RepID=A0ABQ4UYW7_9HYPH|nr:hypothetical protein [Methylorubrum suomiense]GJE77308.1 hypothetical protein BGCPKDLD_3911 [Methylorubrum suomiense]
MLLGKQVWIAVVVSLAGGAAAGVLYARGSSIPSADPCAGSKIPDEFQSVGALYLVTPRLSAFDVPVMSSTPESVERLRVEIDALRKNWLPTISNRCLAAHVEARLADVEKINSGKTAFKAAITEAKAMLESGQANPSR